MGLVINTNVLSNIAQNNLNKASGQLGQSLERLSSGLRINSAKDDAAGLAIATRQTSSIRGFAVAIRNATDASTLLQTADGAMGQITDVLQRMRELAVQSASDSNTASDRSKLNSEMSQLFDQIDSVATQTTFNSRTILNGGAENLNFQVGAEVGETVSLSIDSVTTTDLALNGFSALGELNGGRVSIQDSTITANDILINGVAVSTAMNGASTAETMESAINNSSGDTGVTATAYNAVTGVATYTGVTSGDLIINSNTVAATGSSAELVEFINRDVAGVTATTSSTGAIQLSNDTGATIVVEGASSATSGLTNGSYFGYLSFTSTDGSAITIDHSTAGADSDVQLLGLNSSSGSGNVTGAVVSGSAIKASDKITINGVLILDDGEADVSGNAAAIVTAVNAKQSSTNVTASASTVLSGGTTATATFILESTDTADLVINEIDIVEKAGGAITSITTLLNLINYGATNNTSGTQLIQGVSASLGGSGGLVLTSDTGVDITVAGLAAVQAKVGLSSGTTRGKLTLESTNGGDVLIGSNLTELSQSAALSQMGLNRQGGNTTAIGSTLDITTQANAEVAITRIDDALESIANSRADLGAVQNRLQSTVSVLQVQTQNIESARSVIMDADFAFETAQLTKNQILQQAGISILSQANALPQAVLSLLQ